MSYAKGIIQSFVFEMGLVRLMKNACISEEAQSCEAIKFSSLLENGLSTK